MLIIVSYWRDRIDSQPQCYGHLSIMTSNEYLILASKLRLRFAPGQAKKDHRGPQTDQHVHASVSWE